MRRSLIVTVAAAVSMVLLAMLVPMAVLVRSYALEDRLSRAALEVQATETVVSRRDKGAVAVYLDRINATSEGISTTVLYPGAEDVGPNPGEDDRVREARRTGRARIDDTPEGAQFLVPVSLGATSTVPSQTPVIRVDVRSPGLGAGVVRAWGLLAALGLVLLAGSLFVADRLGRSFVQPIRALAARAQTLGDPGPPEPLPVVGPPEVRELGTALNRLVQRIQVLLQRERESVADLSHGLRTPITTLRLRVDGLPDPDERARLSADLDELEGMVDHLVREARRSEREGLVAEADAVGVLLERIRFWEPLAEDQGRDLRVAAPEGHPVPVRASARDLVALVDVLFDNVFSYTAEGTPLGVTLSPAPAGGLELVVDDAGPGLPPGLDVTSRGASGAGSTGLGLSIVDKTATESGGRLVLGRSPLGGARITVVLGPPA